MGTSTHFLLSGHIMHDPRLTQVGENRVANIHLELLRDTARGTQRLIFQVAAWNDLADSISQVAQKDNGIIFSSDWMRVDVYNNAPRLSLDIANLIAVTDEVVEHFMQLHIIGNVASDVRSNTTGQTRVANFNVAVNRGRGDNRETTFYRIASWNSQSDIVNSYIRKGDPVHVLVDWLQAGLYNNQPTLQSDALRLTLLSRGSNGSAEPQEEARVSDIPF